jgi:hypothetical protein
MESITEPFETAAVDTDPLDIVVPYTTAELTRLALMKAAELSLDVPSRIRILRTQRVPFPLQLQEPPVAVEVLREQTEKIARGLRAAEIQIFLTRDAEATLLDNLRPESIIVIASYKRRWPTSEERLKKLCERNGRRVALVYSK